jgi:cell cycle sensor histidine kinase DivJ
MHHPAKSIERPAAPPMGAFASPEAAWQGAWVIGMAAAAGLLLLLAPGVAAQVLLSFALMAAPGIMGSMLRKAGQRLVLVALWAAGAVLAGAFTGGIGGPLAVWCLTPLAAALVLGADWRPGAGFSLGAALVLGLISALGLAAPLAEPARSWIAFLAVVAMAAALAAAAVLALRRAEDRRRAAEAELHSFQGMIGDLPDLALAMDDQGRPEAVFGHAFEGVDAATLHHGLQAVAAPADHASIDAALAEAIAGGAAAATVASAASPDQRIAIGIRRTAKGPLLAVLRPAPTLSGAAPAQDDFYTRLAAAETARREAEIGRDKAEADAAARARFLANMSHELRTPLNAIMGFSDIMKAKMFGDLAPKYVEYAGLIHESGGHLLDLINDVLDMSKIEANRYELSLETFDVREALNAALRIMRLQADDAGVKLRAVLPGEPLMIDADRRAVKQIALNLLSNAVKFTPRDGVVILTAKPMAGLFELVVADNGMGIAEADLKRLGQPFEQAGEAKDRTRGTGLGLSLVEAFARLHGGTMMLESRLGEGTAVTVRMPVLAPAATELVPLAAAPSVAPEPVVESSPEPVVESAPEPANEAWTPNAPSAPADKREDSAGGTVLDIFSRKPITTA